MQEHEFIYKTVKIPAKLEGLVNHMPDVERYREELSNLGGQWDLFTILGKMNNMGTDMSSTQQSFQELTFQLLGQLGLETLRKTVQNIKAKAQVVVDIVIRNLFERTADIGFLSTDDDIRAFLSHTDNDLNDQNHSTLEFNHSHIIQRFKEYVAKYSVYFDIILLDTHGNVKARLDQNYNVQHSNDSFIQDALSTSKEYVEIYRETDLLPGEGDSLIYAYRIQESNNSQAKSIGVLALCFRFQNEMKGIFSKLHNAKEWGVLTLLDKTGKVIASSDEEHIRIGAQMELALDGDFNIARFAGREYLAKTCETGGYEGYMGLGWFGHVMLPLQHAFAQADTKDLEKRIDKTTLSQVLSSSQLFSNELRNIPLKAELIQSELERTVWNGNVDEKNDSTKVLLWSISNAGERTKSVFKDSIDNLYETVISSILQDVEFQAALAVDIMDRNLYERANDCRWWALTSEFKRLLALDSLNSQNLETITNILKYINNLYTVYTNLFVFDKQGKILAVSDSEQSQLVGTHLDHAWVKETLSIRDSQKFAVSDFEKTDLYNQEHTFIYGAAITELTNSSIVLGGIGIVFDSTPQFSAMLNDSLSKDDKGNAREGSFGLFTNRHGSVISSTTLDYQPGDKIEIDPTLLALNNGEKTSKIVVLNNKYYAVGACTSAGYREYKVNDGYVYDVVGLVFYPVAPVKDSMVKQLNKHVSFDNQASTVNTKDTTDLATFYIGGNWFGINASDVCKAIEYKNVTGMPGMHSLISGKTLFDDQVIFVISLHQLLNATNAVDPARASIVVVELTLENKQKVKVGLVVDALGQIPRVNNENIDREQSVLDENELVDCIVKPSKGSDTSEILIVLNLDYLLKQIQNNGVIEKPQILA